MLTNLSETWPMLLFGVIVIAAMVVILVAILLDLEEWFEHWEGDK